MAGIIGLVGRSRSGKDTVAGLIQEWAAPHTAFTIVRLSAPIKEAARALFQFSDEQLEGPEKEQMDSRWGITPRRVFQTITETTMRTMGDDFFTRILYDKYDRGILGSHIIIPDVRYIHDILEIQRRGGWVIKIERPTTELPHTYACENHLDGLTGLATLHNTGTIEALRGQLGELIKTHLVPLSSFPRNNK